mgnify:FL=1|jgi:hypothetical protein|tara:strand:- start:2168 stop:2572 length:405 start_codon:yes stop_codon:yes gene_type:complete
MIKQKKKLCNNCNTEQFIWKNDKGSKYCKNCWQKSKVKTTKPLKRKPINQKSKKMQILDQAYIKLRKKFMEENPICQCSMHCCNGAATDCHHKKGRGKYHLVVNTWMSVCRQCHNWIHDNPKEAQELGFLESKE